MEKQSLINLNDGFKYALIGIFFYPVMVFFGNLFPQIYIYITNNEMTYPFFIKFLLNITPCFSAFFLVAVFYLTKVNIGIPFEKPIQKTFRILMSLYVLFSFFMAYSAVAENNSIIIFASDFKTVLWRFGSILSFIYVAYMYFDLNELEWGIITLGFLAISLFEDIYFYLLRIESLTKNTNSYSIDETLMILSAIVLFGTIFLIANLRKKITNKIINKFPDTVAGELSNS